jgi:hypothetical protein
MVTVYQTTRPKQQRKQQNNKARVSIMTNKKKFKKSALKAGSRALPVLIPHYRQLKQNLYRPPSQRPLFDSVEDADVCSCIPPTPSHDGDRCGPDCQNRALFM